ncbi:AAA family ATPase [Enterocloster clostridioformis]|uniref:AAA family ATPase n=1 Tax=Enterocloster clostridioformis TaxID=1531 RepID=UPI0034A57C62
MDNNILSALKYIDVATLTRADWIAVGMALKEEGFPCSVWDDWSRNDSRYHAGECEKKWAGFHGNGKPVKGGTIVQMAKDRGWTLFGEDGCMGWDDAIEYDGEDSFTGFTPAAAWNPVQDLITYLETLFLPDEKVCYVSNDVWQNSDGKWVPSKGAYDRTAGELIKSLKKHPDDIGATIGDCKPEAGGWIRFNPVDGDGVKNENVTRFTYALVESDTLPIAEQDILFRKLELPIAALVHSGGKSLHAIVRVDAADYEEYRKRVEFLYDFLEKHGVAIDKQNRNPSRLSRMPGVTRNGNRQYLVATNIGRKSWVDWMDYVEGVSDELPDMVQLSEYKDNPPELPEELIEGILRRGHKMLILGSSKAGKSFLLMELCIAIAEGRDWLGFHCKQGKVLYVNLEIDPASAINRFLKIYEALKIPAAHSDNIVVWNLRGHAVPLDQLVPKLIRRVRDQHFDAIIIDPIYKVITGDENNASEMGQFCNQFDKICTETDCSTIYCHHHSKGAQGAKKAMDRASGSGVFARDPDAQLDMIELELTDEIKNFVRDGNATGWRLESSLREFPNITPVNFWFEYPIHRIDSSGELQKAYAEGTPMGNLSKSKKYSTPEERRSSIDSAYAACSINDKVTVKDLAEYIGVSERCVRDRLKEADDAYWVHQGIVGRKTEDGKAE